MTLGGTRKIPDRAIGDCQRPARVEHNAVRRGLDPVEDQVAEVDGVIWPRVDGDVIAGRAVDAGALDACNADRIGDGYAAIMRGIEHLDLAAGTGLAERELERAARVCGRGASTAIGALARDKGDG